MSRLWAIGDIHGFSLALDKILEQIAPEKDDTLVTLGDYIDRGPDTRGVIERLRRLSQECHTVFLRGNHEEMLLSLLARETLGNHSFDPSDFVKKFFNYLVRGKYTARQVQFHEWIFLGGRQTLASYGLQVRKISQIPLEHLHFLEETRLYYETENVIFTHAAYLPTLPMPEQPLEALLYQRLRNGIPAPHFSGKRVVVGHSAQRSGKILNAGHLLCIDTCLYGGGCLTAMEMNTQKIIQVDAAGKTMNNEQ
ncbi:MAG: metallophosphoesterase family protein [Planctomycetia bacterium]|nr:metallophosphoesterase family protein [Planctomycetia bacterium]